MLSAEPKDGPKEEDKTPPNRYLDPKTSPLHETGASPGFYGVQGKATVWSH